MIRKILFGLICFLGSCTPVYADNGLQVDTLLNGLRTTSGQPLANGKVYTYDGGTSTPRALYTTLSKSVSATNPIILDETGRAVVYGDGIYRFVVKDSKGNTIYTMDNLVYQNIDTTLPISGGASTGSSNTYAIAPSPALSSYTQGLQVDFISNFANTGPATLNVSSLGAIGIKRWDGTALVSGDIPNGALIRLVYVDGSPGVFRAISIVNSYRASASLIPEADNTYDLGSGSRTFKSLYLSGDVHMMSSKGIFYPSAGSFFALGTEGSGYSISGANGAYLAVGGKSFASGLTGTSGTAEIISSDAPDGSVALRSNGATSGYIDFATSSTSRFRIDKDGILKPVTDNAYDIGTSSLRLRKLYGYAMIGDSPTDGSDTSGVQVGGSSTSRGGYLLTNGNENASPGLVQLKAGAVSGGNVSLDTSHATSEIDFGINGTNKWKVSASGNMEPSTDGSVDLGATGSFVRHVDAYRMLIKESVAPSAPAAGTYYLYIDSGTHLLSIMNSSGAVKTGTAIYGALN